MGRKPYVKPVVRKIDSQGAEGKRLQEKARASERRRSERVKLQTPVQVYLSMPDGRVLRLDGFTQVVNAHGCLLGMEYKVEIGQRVTLLNPESGAKQSSTVMNAQRAREGHFAVALEFDSPTPQLWSPEHPSEN